MKKILLLIVLFVITFGMQAQDHYNRKYSLGINSSGKWYKLFEIDLNNNGNYNSVNIAVDFNYVNTESKYNSSAFIRLRESTTSSESDWQNNVSGIKQTVLKLKKTSSMVYELWGYSNGLWGHFSFECSITKESNLIVNIPEIPTPIADVNLHEDVPYKGEWYFSSGDFIVSNGNVGIGTINPGSWKLAVNGQIRAKEIKVETEWSDFVFEKDYNLPSLKEVEIHIKEKGHLKDIPSAKEVTKNGIFLGEMDAKLLQKIEELTLYTIAQEKKIRKLEKENQEIKSLSDRLFKIEKQLESKE